MELVPDIVFYFAVLIGVVVRTILPWLTKKADDPTLSFDPKFVWTAILAIITAFIELGVVLIDAPDALSMIPSLKLVGLMGFFFGMGNNEIWNRILHRGTKQTNKT